MKLGHFPEPAFRMYFEEVLKRSLSRDVTRGPSLDFCLLDDQIT
jgi:hypothetical protein